MRMMPGCQRPRRRRRGATVDVQCWTSRQRPGAPPGVGPPGNSEPRGRSRPATATVIIGEAEPGLLLELGWLLENSQDRAKIDSAKTRSHAGAKRKEPGP
jgi:hypothetical protein